MAVTLASFREAFPAFEDVTEYPDGMAELWLSAAVQLVNADRWGELTDLGVMLYTAHNLVIDAMDARRGVVPGASLQGVVTSKSVGGVSVGIDASTTAEEGAGNWNLTTYGTRFYRLSRLLSAGPVQVGSGVDPQGASAAVGAWPGPYAWPF